MMAYTAINAQKLSVAGVALTESNGLAGGAGTGYSVSNDGKVKLFIRNSASNTPNVVVEANGTIKGFSISGDQTIAVGALGIQHAGPYDPEIFGTTLQINFTGSNETEMRIAAFRE
jgi:hypothetical protein